MKHLLLILLCSQLVFLSAFSLKPRAKQIYEKSTQLNHVFESLENETKLASYFMNSNQHSNCLLLSGEERSKYIERFWQSLDPNPITAENEFLIEIRQRVNFTETELRNAQSGWKSDQGRIYIKYGKPFEILEGEIQSSEYHGRSYQIWKYRLDIDQQETFIFFELHTYGDLRLIYSESNSEVSFADWQRFFGDMDINLIIGGYYE
ncbi:MAG: GWxTD domain-containing protein [Candidatus Cloacimonadales bacterium]